MAETEYVVPRTEAERIVAQIWAEVLGVERVGIHDQFFALGGHSLRATRVVSHVRRALGTDVPVRALFEASTLSGFVEQMERSAAPVLENPEPEMMTRDTAEAALAAVDALDEEELDRLLSALALEEDADW